MKVPEHEACLLQLSEALKFTVTVPPLHKIGAVKLAKPEVNSVPLPPVAVNPATHVANAASKAA